MGEIGVRSRDSEFSVQARRLSAEAALAYAIIRAGGDAQKERAGVREVLDDLIEFCHNEGYLTAPARS